MMLNLMSAAEGLQPCYEEDGSDGLGSPYACLGYRFPTEAEWEYAARAGESYAYSGSDDVDAVAWWHENSQGESHATCTIDPDGNAWGFCDMSGNQSEYTNDWLGDDYSGMAEVDPEGVESGWARVCRGGHYLSDDEGVTVSVRAGCLPEFSDSADCFRVARTVP